MAGEFENVFRRILRAAERKRKKQRKPYLGDTAAGRAQRYVRHLKAMPFLFPEPERVDVPPEFLQKQPRMRRPQDGIFQPARKGRKRR